MNFGIAFAGRKATNVSRVPSGLGSFAVGTARSSATAIGPGNAPPEPEAPVLTAHGGSGSDSRWDQSCWVWGLPPEGPMGVVVRWTAQGIEETRVDIDAAAILKAAGRAQVVWDD